MSAGAKSKTAGRWQDAVVSRKSTDERSTEISAMKVNYPKLLKYWVAHLDSFKIPPLEWPSIQVS